ncbi:MAG TPA: hypothetical protein VGK74_16345 [Symbiobacteriaceae bacterium]|jgi:hypothetical protein
MTTVKALLSFMQGEEFYRRRAAGHLPGNPVAFRLFYLDGHPSISRPQSVWIGRVGGRLRLVGERGERTYDIPIARISGLGYDPQGLLRLRFEPTAGLVSTAVFQAGDDAAASYQQLLHLIAITA